MSDWLWHNVRMSGELVSTMQIAQMAGVQLAAVTNWASRYPDFPRPMEYGAGRGRPVFYDVDEVTAWLEAHLGRRPNDAQPLAPLPPIPPPQGPEDGITITDIADMAGVSLAAVTNWIARYPDFPQPIGSARAQRFYDANEIMAWLQGRGRV